MSCLRRSLLCLLGTALASFVIFASSAPGGSDQAPAKWTPQISLNLKKVKGVQVSPDGKRVLYTVTETVMNDTASEYRTHLHLSNADGTSTFQLTHGDKSCDNPQWSPDGARIAFLSARSGKRNLWLLPVNGGEAEQLTDMKTGVGSFKWSPNGAMIAFTAGDGPTPEEEKAAKMKNDARTVDQNIKMVRLHVVPTAKDAAGKRPSRLLTRGDFSVTGAFDWSPDAKAIAFTRGKAPSPDHWPSADIYLANVDSAELRPLAAGKAAEMSPLFSPDGKWIACTISDDPPTWPRKMRVHLVPAQGGAPKPLALAHDESPNLVGWSEDSGVIYFTEANHTATKLWALPVGGEPRPVSSSMAVIGEVHLNASRSAMGFTLQSSRQPAEAYLARLDRFVETPISKVNKDLPALPAAAADVISWKSKDGMEVEGLLTYPVGYEKGKRYPLLLVIHGGPAGVFSETFIGNAGPYPIATFAAEGFLVLRVNPRGSSGYGAKFRYANVKDWGGGDYQDLMTGVDHVIKLGLADEHRLGVMGWSYGGFMTSWIVTQTKRFKAASVGAGVTNLASFTGTADIPSFLPSYFGGEFWDHPGLYEKHSAMFHVKNVATPTLIQHGEKDDRVPISQGYEFYNALKRQGVTTTMTVYPRMPHGPTEPRHLLDIMNQNVEWMGKFLK